MKPKLILHIGLHKTGTTTIQKFLLSRRLELINQGWDLFHKNPNGSTTKTGNCNLWINFKGKKQNLKAIINPNFFKELKKIKSNLIVSSEEISWLSSDEEIKEFKSKLSKIFNKITVICYLRRQDLQLLSHYQQGFKYPHSVSRIFYGEGLCIIPKHHSYFSRYLNYSNKLRTWEKHFGSENLLVKEFDRAKLLNNDLLSDFINLLPVKINYVYQKNQRTNESTSITQSIINNALFKTRYNLWYDLGGGNFTSYFFNEHSTKPQLNRKQSKEILSHYIESNKYLIKYISNLSTEWTNLDTIKSPEEVKGNTIENSDYQNSLIELLRFIDQMSILDFIRFKRRKIGRKVIRFFSNFLR